MGHNVSDFIKVYENSLDENVCKFLIQLFESNSDKHEKIKNNGIPNFTQFNLTEYNTINLQTTSVHNFLITLMFNYKKEYYKLFNSICFPTDHSIEQFRIKKYKNDGNDLFDTHVDIKDHLTSKRFLSFLWYLNDVNIGGETIFDGISIIPKQGTLIMFPPMWMFPHKGNPPVSNEKYILSTYLHYL